MTSAIGISRRFASSRSHASVDGWIRNSKRTSFTRFFGGAIEETITYGKYSGK